MAKWSAVFFGIFIIGIIVLADLGRLGIFRIINEIPFGDKIGHFILYGMLAFLIEIALIQSFPQLSRNLILFRVSIILSLLIGIEEYSQRYFVQRTFSLMDLAFSYAGVLFFTWLAWRRSKGGPVDPIR